MALKRYSIGDTIVDSQPFVHSLSNDRKEVLCDYCFETIGRKEDNRHECHSCLRMYYCSDDCRRSDDRFHRNECPIYCRYYYPYLQHHFIRLMLRSYLMLYKDKEHSFHTKTYHLYDGKKRCFNCLKTHSEEISLDTKRLKIFAYINETFGYFAEEFEFVLNLDKLFELFCRLNINHFQILDYNQTNEVTIGSSVYISASILNHSCDPNSATIYFGTTLVLKAIKTIEVGDEITINYIDLEVKCEERQNRLRQTFYFECDCNKCLNNDFGINYVFLKRIKHQINSQLIDPMTNWRTIDALSHKYTDICHQIYGHFHPQFIACLIRILSIKLRINCEDNRSLNLFKDEVQKRVELIFGSNHVIHNHLRQCLENNLLFKL